MSDSNSASDTVTAQVRDRYAAAAVAVQHGSAGSCCDDGCGCGGTAAALEQDESFGAGLYTAGEQAELPAEAVLASLGCGNPTAVADLRAGERVLDLGSGGGIDVLLSARRVGPTGRVFGVDMTDEMLAVAQANKATAGADNVEFLKGTIEAIPLPAASVDVVISNCVINLSVDKPAVLAEMARVLVPGGRIGISDVVAEDHLTPDERAERGSYVGCIAGALSRSEYLDGLAAAGFVEASVEFTHEAAPGIHSAIIKAAQPPAPDAGIATAATAAATTTATAQGTTTAVDTVAAAACCTSSDAVDCCAVEAQASCCGDTTAGLPSSCGCR